MYISIFKYSTKQPSLFVLVKSLFSLLKSKQLEKGAKSWLLQLTDRMIRQRPRTCVPGDSHGNRKALLPKTVLQWA